MAMVYKILLDKLLNSFDASSCTVFPWKYATFRVEGTNLEQKD